MSSSEPPPSVTSPHPTDSINTQPHQSFHNRTVIYNQHGSPLDHSSHTPTTIIDMVGQDALHSGTVADMLIGGSENSVDTEMKTLEKAGNSNEPFAGETLLNDPSSFASPMGYKAPKRRVASNMRVDLMDNASNAPRGFPNNAIRTSKYTVITFIPLNLFLQFRRVNNLFFLLVMSLTLIPGATPVEPLSAIAPLCLVVGLAALKDAFEDFKRHQSDKVANSIEAHVLRGDGEFEEIPSADVQVGDIMKIYHGEEIRADCVILASSLPEGLAYIETSNLDGETNAKTKKSLEVTSLNLGTAQQLMARCNANFPSAMSMKERFCQQVSEVPSTMSQGLRGGVDTVLEGMGFAKLPNNDNEKRFALRADPDDEDDDDNATTPSRRHSDISYSVASPNGPQISPYDEERRQHSSLLSSGTSREPTIAHFSGGRNRYGVRLIVELPNPSLGHWQGQLKLASNDTYPLSVDNFLFRGATLRNTEWVLAAVVYSGVESKMFLNLQQKPPKRSQFDKQLNMLVIMLFVLALSLVVIFASLAVAFHSDEDRWYIKPFQFHRTAVSTWGWRFITHFILLSYVVPLSLFITLEVNKGLQVLFISMDLCLSVFDENLSERRYCRPKTSNLTSQLARVKYIFADKTGTLTENSMMFVGGYMNGIKYHTSDAVVISEEEPAAGPTPSQQVGNSIVSPVAADQDFTDIVVQSPLTRKRVTIASPESASPTTSQGSPKVHEVSGPEGLGLELVKYGFEPSKAFVKRRQQEEKVRELVAITEDNTVAAAASIGMNATVASGVFSQHKHGRSMSIVDALRSTADGAHARRAGHLSQSHAPFASETIRPGSPVNHGRVASVYQHTSTSLGIGVLNTQQWQNFQSHSRGPSISAAGLMSVGGYGSMASMSAQISHKHRQLERSSLFMYLLSLSACHNVVCFEPDSIPSNKKEDDSKPVKLRKIYEGQSLDEVALVKAAADNFFELVERTSKDMTIEIMGRCYTYDIIAELEFTPQRKLMSIILKRNRTKDRQAHARRKSYLHSRNHSGMPSVSRNPQHTSHQSTSVFGSIATRNANRALNDSSPDEAPQPRHTRKPTFVINTTPAASPMDELDESRVLTRDRTYAPSPASHNASPVDILDTADDDEFPYLMLSKGADSSFLPLVDMSVLSNQTAMAPVERSLEEMATTGLRTLVLGYRRLSQENIDEFLPVLKAAQCAMGDRNAVLHEAYAKIEHDFSIIGATAVEDKLQDGVPETIDFFVRAKVVVWMLTGDKRETAVTIAGTSGIIDPNETEVFHIDVTHLAQSERNESCRYQIQMASEKIRALPQNTAVLVIDGITLSVAFSGVGAELFFELGSMCRAAVCCRMTPLQKADIVRMFQTTTGHVALAIGDGANDVSMIQEAEIGIGIMGLEGAQAELAADFAIPKFRCLKRLLVVHGRHNLYRDANTVLYSCYKNLIMVTAMALYTTRCGFSGQTIYQSWLLAMYNTLYCQIQALTIGIFDKDLPDEVLETNPLLYPELAEKKCYFNPREWVITIIEAILLGAALYFTVFLTFESNDLDREHTPSLRDQGTIAFLALTAVVDLAAGLRFMRSWTYLTLGTAIIGFVLLVATTFTLSAFVNFSGSTGLYGMAERVFSSFLLYVHVLIGMAGFFVCISLLKYFVVDEVIWPTTSANKVVEKTIRPQRSMVGKVKALLKEFALLDMEESSQLTDSRESERSDEFESLLCSRDVPVQDFETVGRIA